MGNPDPKHISTSLMSSARISRCGCTCGGLLASQTDSAKKVENHAYALAIHYMHYNFCRVHETLRVTPAMEAGITDHVWTIEEMLKMVL